MCLCVSNKTIIWSRRGMRGAVTARVITSASKFTLGATVRMKHFYLEGHDWSYRLLVEERWTCIRQ
jgi:hypothetical protein